MLQIDEMFPFLFVPKQLNDQTAELVMELDEQKMICCFITVVLIVMVFRQWIGDVFTSGDVLLPNIVMFLVTYLLANAWNEGTKLISFINHFFIFSQLAKTQFPYDILYSYLTDVTTA